MLRLRQHAHLAAEQHVARVAHHHLAAGMVGALGAVDALDVRGLVPGEDVAHVQRADDLALAVDQGHRLAGLQRARPVALSTGKRQRNRPGVLLAVVDDDFLVEHAVERGPVHRAGQRAQAAVAEAVERGQVGVADRAPS